MEDGPLGGALLLQDAQDVGVGLAAVAEPHVDDCVSRRGFFHLHQAVGNKLGGDYGKAALLERLGEPLQEGKVVLDDQQRSFAGDFLFCRRGCGLARQSVHGVTIICADLTAY